MRQPARVHNFANTVLWIYIVLLLVGGLIGFFKAKSRVSLISSSVFAAVLVLTQTGIFKPSVSLILANVLLAALLVVFAIRLAKTKKFMPSGLMLVLTVLTLALRNLFPG
ncbi:MAG: TMEM14 family protein [Verrucomicrobiia bacterium]